MSKPWPAHRGLDYLEAHPVPPPPAPAPVREAHGIFDEEDRGWRSLSGNTKRVLPGAATAMPSTAESTEMAGVMIASP